MTYLGVGKENRNNSKQGRAWRPTELDIANWLIRSRARASIIEQSKSISLAGVKGPARGMG